MSSEINHTEFYKKADLYDLAFRFKKVEQENQTILTAYSRINGKHASSFLDIAAGPASNAIEMAARGLKTAAIDYSPEMTELGLRKAKQLRVNLSYATADMRNFRLQEKFDIAAIFMDSTSYLFTNEDVLTHLRTVANHLNDNGLYFLEMSHPRDVFNVGKSSSTEWTETDGSTSVTVKWGDEKDTFDPITQTTEISAHLEFRTAQGSGSIIDRCTQRCFTYNEIDALVRASGCFTICEVLGSFEPGIPFTNEKAAWRMIPVLRKI